MLAILLLNANRVVSVERLADDLYSGAPPVTAVTQVQRQVSDLRKLLGPAAIETKAPGYLVHAEPGSLDLDRFQADFSQAREEVALGNPARGAELLRQALALWRGAPLADLEYESFARVAIERLEELRLEALEERIDADLALGRHREVLAELESLVWDNPFRERLSAQLMLALYRSGRQAEALDVYRRARSSLVEQFGIDPSPLLRERERAILAQEPSLEFGAAASSPPAELSRSTVLLAAGVDSPLEPLLAVARLVSAAPDVELIVARLVADEDAVAAAALDLDERRENLPASARVAAFASVEPARDVVRLASSHDAALILLDGPAELANGAVPAELAVLLEHSPADVGVLTGEPADRAILVPFGGGSHDWAALELGARLAGTAGAGLRLAGTRASRQHGRRDASRLLADAALAVQRVVGVDIEPLLLGPEPEALLAAADDAGLVVVGLSSRWREQGLGIVRQALLAGPAAVLLVHRGPKPGPLAPRDSRTRFSWSLEP